MKERYILGGSPVLIRALAEVMIADPEFELITLAGPPGAPVRIVANMPPERADLLSRALSGHLTIERDEDIHPFV